MSFNERARMRAYGAQDGARDEPLLDFTFDGTMKMRGRFNAARRGKIRAVRDLVGQVSAGLGGQQALREVLVTMAEDVEKVIAHFERCAATQPAQAEYCAASIEAYGRARAALDRIYMACEGDVQAAEIMDAYAALESAVTDVDALVGAD